MVTALDIGIQSFLKFMFSVINIDMRVSCLRKFYSKFTFNIFFQIAAHLLNGPWINEQHTFDEKHESSCKYSRYSQTK